MWTGAFRGAEGLLLLASQSGLGLDRVSSFLHAGHAKSVILMLAEVHLDARSRVADIVGNSTVGAHTWTLNCGGTGVMVVIITWRLVLWDLCKGLGALRLLALLVVLVFVLLDHLVRHGHACLGCILGEAQVLGVDGAACLGLITELVRLASIQVLRRASLWTGVNELGLRVIECLELLRLGR